MQPRALGTLQHSAEHPILYFLPADWSIQLISAAVVPPSLLLLEGFRRVSIPVAVIAANSTGSIYWDPNTNDVVSLLRAVLSIAHFCILCADLLRTGLTGRHAWRCVRDESAARKRAM